jgi:hypothetical protein
MDLLMKILEQHGLGVALAAVVGYGFWRLVKYILNSHGEDRKVWKEALDMQQQLVMNHITHLNQSNAEIIQTLEQHDKNSENNASAIVKAIEAQTQVLKAYHETPGG